MLVVPTTKKNDDKVINSQSYSIDYKAPLAGTNFKTSAVVTYRHTANVSSFLTSPSEEAPPSWAPV